MFFDPPKTGVLQTIAALSELGVQLKIITGDNRLVALRTAEAVGLKVTGVLTGADLNNLRDEALWHESERVTSFLR